MPTDLCGLNFAIPLPAEMTRRQAFQLVAYWQKGGNSFGCEILNLLGKADMENKARLKVAFPMLCQAYTEWHLSELPEELLMVELEQKNDGQG